MEYRQRRELKSEPASERTSMMMRSVREILEEQGQAHLLDNESFTPASEAPTVPPRPMPKQACQNGVQRPPHMQGKMAAPKAAPAPLPFRAQAPETQPAEKSRSLLARLIGR